MTGNAFRPGAVPPHSVEAEESVCGGILVHPKKFVEVSEFLTMDDFYHPALRCIYEAMYNLDHDRRPIDALTVYEQMKILETADKLRAFAPQGGQPQDYLTELMSKVVTVENIAYHARLVKGKANARRVVEVTREISAQGYGDYGDSEQYVDESERKFLEATRQAMRSTFEHARPILKEVVKDLHVRVERKSAITGVATGYHKLDAMTAGLQPADVIYLAARPSMGKSSLAMNIADHVSVNLKLPALVFSLEMSKKSLMERTVCSRGRIDSTKVRCGMMETRDWVMFDKAAGEIAAAPLYIDEGNPTLMEIRAKARRFRADRSIFTNPDMKGLVVIDYMQLIETPPVKGQRNRQQEISDLSRGLKSLAKELGLPLLVLCQLNRALEAREDKRPMMSDLRESGALEQDGDVLLFIYRDEVYSKDECKEEDKGVAEIIVGKQRNGPTGTIRLAFLDTYTKFENLAEGRDYS